MAMKLTKSDKILEELATKVDAFMATLPIDEQKDRIKKLKAYAASLRQKRRTTTRNTRESVGRRRVSQRSA